MLEPIGRISGSTLKICQIFIRVTSLKEGGHLFLVLRNSIFLPVASSMLGLSLLSELETHTVSGKLEKGAHD